MIHQLQDEPRESRTRAIWFHLLREGGRWKTSEINQALEWDGDDLSNYLASMTKRGYLVRHYDNGRPEYSVSHACKIPYGTKMVELSEAMGQ